MLRRLFPGKGTATATYSLQPEPHITISSSLGGGGGGTFFFFSTALPRSSSSSSSDSPLAINFFRSYGFREEDTDVILRKFPRLRNANVENTLRPKLDFLVSTNLTVADISEILVANPYILENSVERAISYINFLKTILSSKGDLIRVLKRSNLATTIESNVEVLKKRGVAGTHIRNMLISEPNALSRRKEEFMAALGHVEDLGLSPDDGSPYARALGVMSYMSRSTILRKVELFKKLGWSDDQAAELIRKCPTVLCLSEDNIRKTMEFLMEKVGWSEDQVLEAIRKYPTVLGLSDDNITKKMEFFREKVGLGTVCLYRNPALLGRSVDNIRKKMEFLREKMGWSSDQVVELIRKYPTVLGLSEDTITKKMEFFTEKVGLGADCLYRNPDLFGRSVEKRFIPRCAVLNILVSRGLLKKFVFSPHWLRYTDKYFFDNYVRRYEGKVPDVADAFRGQIDFLGWSWMKDDDDNNQQYLHKIPSSQAP